MSSSAVFYIPLLHAEYAGSKVPPQVSFAHTGAGNPQAPQREAAATALAAEEVFCSALPLSQQEARAVLEQMLSFGEDYASEGSLLQRAMMERITQSPASKKLHDEFAALEAFAALDMGLFDDEDETEEEVENESSLQGMPFDDAPRGQGWADLPAAPTAQDIHNALVDCQKTLLLAYELEKRNAEISGVLKEFHKARHTLRTIITGHEDDDELESLFMEEATVAASGDLSFFGGALGDPASDDDTVIGADWRTVLEAVLPFVPQGTVFYTADTRMAHDLRDAGMLFPLPEDRAVLCQGWPLELVNGLMLACLPAWRLVGHKSLPPDRPWLAGEIEILVARPRGGWQRPAGGL